MSQQALRQVLPQLPITLSRNVLVSSKTFDDAGVYRLDRQRALVQTVDFFTPIVDDPFSYGQIAAANSLSDIYAMGGRPLTALNIIGFPEDLVSPRVVSSILRGGLAKAAEVGCVIIGGHSIRNPEPIYGLAVTGLVDVRHVTTNANARPGDVLKTPADDTMQPNDVDFFLLGKTEVTKQEAKQLTPTTAQVAVAGDRPFTGHMLDLPKGESNAAIQ